MLSISVLSQFIQIFKYVAHWWIVKLIPGLISIMNWILSYQKLKTRGDNIFFLNDSVEGIYRGWKVQKEEGTQKSNEREKINT